MPKEIVAKRYLTTPEALAILSTREEEGELTDITRKTLEYLRLFSKTGFEDAKRIVAEVKGLGVSEEVAVMLANICPGSIDEIRTILAYERRKVYTTEEVERILEILTRYCMESTAS